MANGVSIDLIVDPKKAILGLGQVESKSTSVANTLGKIGHLAAVGFVALGAATLAAGAGITALVATSVKAAAESQKVAAQTAAVLTSTGQAANRSAEQVGALATKLSRLSGIDDEVVQGAENMLLTFTNIKGDTFDKAAGAALDMSVALGTDASSAAQQLGKALNDPVAGITKLTKIGVTFSDQQKKQIANYVKLGDTAAAQGVIIAELNKEFGGSALAFGNTLEGSIGKVKTAFGNIKEEIGGAFLPALTAAATVISDAFDAITDNPKIQSWLDTLNSKATAALKPLVGFIGDIANSPDPFGTLIAGLTKASPIFAILVSVFEGLKPQLPLILDGFKKLGDALGSGIAKYGPDLATAFGQIVQAIVPLLPKILALVPALLPLIPPLLKLVTTLLPPLATLLTTILPPAIAGTSAALDILGPAVAFVIDGFRGGAQAVGVLFDLLSGNTSLSGFTASLAAIPGPFGDIQKAVQDFGTTVGTRFGEALAVVRDFVGRIQTGVSDIIGFFTGLPNAIAGAVGNLGGVLVNAGKDLINGLLSGAGSLLKNIGSFFLSVLPGWIVAPFKAALGIHSPSTLFAGLGGQVIAGLEKGLVGSNNLGMIMSGLSSQVTSGFGADLNVQARATFAGGYAPTGSSSGSSNGSVPQVNQTIIIPPEQDGKILGRQLGREYVRTIAGALS